MKLKPHQLAIAIGALFAAIVLGSGITATLAQWHDDANVQREVFGNIPSMWKLVFYTVLPVLVLYGSVLFSQRVRNWERGAPDNRRTTAKNAGRRLKDFRAGVYMQTLLRDPAAGIMHSLIYFSFLILLAVTTVLEINHQLPESAKFLHGDVYKGYAAIGDGAGPHAPHRCGVGDPPPLRAAALPHPHQDQARARADPGHDPRHRRHRLRGRGVAHRAAKVGPEYEQWSFVAYPLSTLIDGNDNLAGVHQVWWVGHVATFFLFVAILPVTMLRHIFTSPLNMYLRDRDRPKGAMRPMPNLMETELESFGASTVEDFTWKQLLDTDACTMCGRCTSVCPAHATGKPLDPARSC